MNESQYQAKLIRKLKQLYPDAHIEKNDASYTQGHPDILILRGSNWGMLEVKISADAPVQPNQPHYVDKFNKMSFAAFIYPEIEERVLNELQQALRP